MSQKPIEENLRDRATSIYSAKLSKQLISSSRAFVVCGCVVLREVKADCLVCVKACGVCFIQQNRVHHL